VSTKTRAEGNGLFPTVKILIVGGRDITQAAFTDSGQFREGLALRSGQNTGLLRKDQEMNPLVLFYSWRLKRQEYAILINRLNHF
jgi:hypothetical protein